MRTFPRWLMALTFLVSVAWAQPQPAPSITLHVGDPAPPISAGKWLRGAPVNSYLSGTTYVIVFWATWCPAFLGAMDHLNELQAQYSDKTQVVAVSVFEHDRNAPIGYIEHFASKMDFSVATDKVPDEIAPADKSKSLAANQEGWNGEMVKSWLWSSQVLGLPSAFIVDHNGNIAWIGSAVGNAIDDPLRKIIDNSWDTVAFAQKFTSDQENARAKDALTAQMSEAINAQKWDQALQLCDEMVTYDERAAVAARYLTMLRKGDFDGAYKFARETAAGPAAKDAQTVYALAWLTVNPAAHWSKSDFDLGLLLAKQAVDLSYSKDADMLDLLAWAYYAKKDKDNAIDTEKQAIAISRQDQKGTLERNLKTFQH